MSADNLCRLCGKNTKDYIDIFDENGVKKDLSTKASSCLNIYVYPNDVLPRVMCVPCCSRLDDSYKFFEKSTKIQSQLRSLYQSGKDPAIVRAEHNYAMNIPLEKHLREPQNLSKVAQDVSGPNSTYEEQERALYDLVSNIGAEYTQELELKSVPQDFVLLENQSQSKVDQSFNRTQSKPFRFNAEFNRKVEHNYFRPDPALLPNLSSIRRTVHEMEHNYGRPYPRLFTNENRTESSLDLENNNRCVGRTISDIWEGYPWSCTICDGGGLNSVQVCRVTDARRSYFSC